MSKPTYPFLLKGGMYDGYMDYFYDSPLPIVTLPLPLPSVPPEGLWKTMYIPHSPPQPLMTFHSTIVAEAAGYKGATYYLSPEESTPEITIYKARGR